jgi:hypothetical protein
LSEYELIHVSPSDDDSRLIEALKQYKAAESFEQELAAIDMISSLIRRSAYERCAAIAEDYDSWDVNPASNIADRIRALK